MRTAAGMLVVCALLGAAGTVWAHQAEPFRVIYYENQVTGNPAEKYAGRVIEAPRTYHQEVPDRCSRAGRRGVTRFARWLRRNTKHGTVGSRYRCQKLGGGIGYSFHSEGRALDFALTHGKRRHDRTARRLLTLMLAPDSTGEPAALARRMGVMEIIWDCGYWAQGKEDFQLYFMCDGTRYGAAQKSIEHRDHIHFSFTRDGAAGRTSFWRPVADVPFAPPPQPVEPEPEPAPPPPEPEPEPDPEPEPEPDPEPEPPTPPSDCC